MTEKLWYCDIGIFYSGGDTMEKHTLPAAKHVDSDTGYRLRHVFQDTEYFVEHDHDYCEIFLTLCRNMNM